MTASTLPTRPTAEATAEANAAFSWAFRGDLHWSAYYVDQMDVEGLTAVALAASVLSAQVAQRLAVASC